MIKLGEYTKLEVKRLSDLGYMLTDGDMEVLLHFKQAKCEHKVGDKITVFIYSDKQARPTATEFEASVSMNVPGFARVTDILPGAGVFVSIDTPKDVLISKDYLPYDEDLWPKKDEVLFVGLKIRKEMLMAKPLSRFDIIALHKNIRYVEGETVKGIVTRVGDKGIGVITKDPMYIFIPHDQYRGNHHMGEEVDVIITKALEEEYYGKLNANKEDMIEPDKELILDYIDKHHGVIKITAKTPAEVIERELKMSRKAFKRAYGGLYKDKVIDFDDEKTFLVKK